MPESNRKQAAHPQPAASTDPARQFPKPQKPKVQVEVVGQSKVRYAGGEGVIDDVLDLFEENSDARK